MKKTILSTSLGLAMLAAAALAGEFKGTITDAKCKHADASKAGFIKKCLDAGDAVLLSGSNVYTLKGDKEEFKKHAGHKVTVTGDLDGTNLTVSKITMD
jgi:hypothetical protein